MLSSRMARGNRVSPSWPSPSLNFYRAGDGCANSAFASVIAHEYGHFIVDRHGLEQGAFGEGYGDTMAVLVYDNPKFGPDFFGPGTLGRDIENADVQYPCSGVPHICGQLLAGVWWDFRLLLEDSIGEDAAWSFRT